MSTDTPSTPTSRATRKATSQPAASSGHSAPAELAVLRAEVARLRELVGPDEVAYTKLKTELWAARDAAMGAELAAGTLRGRVQALESQLVRVTRQTRWVKRLLISPVRRAKDFVRTI